MSDAGWEFTLSATVEHRLGIIHGRAGNHEGCAGSDHSPCPPCSPLWSLPWERRMSPAGMTRDTR